MFLACPIPQILNPKNVSKIFGFLKISFLEVPIFEHVESDQSTETVQMNNVKIDNRIWRQQMLHNHIQSFQRQVYPVNPAIFQLLAGKVFHDQFYCYCIYYNQLDVDCA